ncbi:MAG: DUF424 family protein [Candidatus Micrarchaeota archaeon]|nr:DUF424 family protein [Candidatus Micrarchaeota archaeon]
MYCKRHESKGKVVFALCDKSLIGKKLQDGNVMLDLDTYRSFYIGDDAALFDGVFESINAVGEESTSFLIRKGIAKKEDIKYICGVPVLQVYKIK